MARCSRLIPTLKVPGVPLSDPRCRMPQAKTPFRRARAARTASPHPLVRRRALDTVTRPLAGSHHCGHLGAGAE